MHLVYIYNNFTLNVFLNLSLFDIYLCGLSFKLVLGHLCERIKELYMSGKTYLRHVDLDMLKSQIWRNSSENLYELI